MASINGKETGPKSERDEIILDGVLDNLEGISYTGPLMEEGVLQSAIEGGLSSSLYVDLCMALYSDLKQYSSLHSTVSRPQGPEDVESFRLEMKSLLQESHCPHGVLIKESLDMLSSYHKRLVLVDFLLSEVLAARLAFLKSRDEAMDVQGSSILSNLSTILKVYEIPTPPHDAAVKLIFNRIIGKTRELVNKAPKGHISIGLVLAPLTSEQLTSLDSINKSLTDEYTVRRNMLLTRCDVTIQSFRWSDKVKGKEEEFSRTYKSRRQSLVACAPVAISRVLAAKQDLITVQKTDNADVRARTQCSVNKVLIGKVPDRGGRPSEARRPQEMPTFKSRTVTPQDQQRGGHGGPKRGDDGRGRGGKVQGGWSGGRGAHKGGSWHEGGGGYQGGGRQKQQYY